MSRSVRTKSIKPDFTAVIKESGRWWIGWIEEVPGVNCQERTREELLETLRVTLREALEMNRTMPGPRPEAISGSSRPSTQRWLWLAAA